jgi:uncharacterized cupin superfamily protein
MGELYSKQLEKADQVEAFEVEAFSTELDGAASNRNIGTTLWLSNDRVNIWLVKLEPGERAPFHTHAIDYFWVCVDGGRGRQRYPDGTMRTFRFEVGEVDFLGSLTHGKPAVHDLENIGSSVMRFVAVELKSS